MGSGKTTTQKLLYDDLRKLLPTKLIISVNFADALKRECALLAGVPIDQFNTEEGKNKILPDIGLTGRQLLQKVGEARRQQNPSYWIDLVHTQVKNELAACNKDRSFQSDEMVVIVGDCRHVNEIEQMRPGLAVRLIGDPAKLRTTPINSTHISETALDKYEDFDMKIDTDTCSKEMVVAAIERQLVLTQPNKFSELLQSTYLA
jgi:hypothetical protein